MEKIDRRTKVMFAVSIAFMLVLFAVASPYASAKTSVSSIPQVEQAIGPQDPLYKYLFHVNVTQYPWGIENYDVQGTSFSASPTAPETNHLLWKATLCRLYEALVNRVPIVANGLVFVRSDTAKSIYPGVTWALDQNSGKIIWTLPAAVSFTYENGILWSSNRAYDPNTGQQLYQLTTKPTLYDPVLKMAFGSGPTGYNWTDMTKEPVQVYKKTDGASIATYDNGKIFSLNVGAYNLTCYDAKTGQKLWSRATRDIHSKAVAKDGKVFCSASEGQSNSGIYCYDQNTGNLIWQDPNPESVIRGYAYGFVYASTTRTYLYAYDANDGHVVWRYAPTRKVPHWCGASIDCNHTQHHSMLNDLAIADGKVYFTGLQHTTYPSLLPPNYPGIEYEGVRYYVNPNPYPVIAHTGENEFVCLDAWTGKVIWRVGLGWPDGPNKGTPDKPAYVGPDMGFPVIADGKVYGIEEPYSGHTGVGTSRPELDPQVRYAESKPKAIISNYWYPGNVYCFGVGPTQMTVTTDISIANTGENVEITVAAVDMSPSHQLAPADGLPVNLRYISDSGASGNIGTVTTGSAGSAVFTWTVPVSGTVTIIASSPGEVEHEAPPDASVTIVVSGGVTLSTIGSIASIVAVTVSAAAITVPIRKRKQEGGEQLEN